MNEWVFVGAAIAGISAMGIAVLTSRTSNPVVAETDEHAGLHHAPPIDAQGARWRFMTNREIVRSTMTQYHADTLAYELARRLDNILGRLETPEYGLELYDQFNNRLERNPE